jgi:hypothetical protein
MSLGDMINIARGAQAYKQAEEVNPLLVQRAQQEARTGQINLGVTEQTDLERKNIQTFMSNPKNWQNETGDVDVNKINAEITKIAPLTGRDQIANLTTLAKSQTENTKAAQDLTQSERAIIAGPIGILARNKVQDKNVYIQELDNVQKYHPDNKRIHRLIETQKNLINQMPEGADVASAGIRVSEGLLTPTEARSAFAPTSTVTGAGQVVTTKPSIAGQNPEVSFGTPQGVAPMPNIVELNGVKYEIKPPTTAGGSPTLIQLGSTQAPSPANVPANPPANVPPSANVPAKPATTTAPPVSSVVPLDLPVANGVVQLNEQQKKRHENGQALIAESSAMAQAAGNSRQTVRQIRENIGEATGSRVGQVLRSAGKWVAGNEQLDELVKGLATNQLEQAKLMGISTDAARETSAQANGSENITVGALTKIINRAEAMNSATEKYNAGLTKFNDKYGAYNGPIHTQKFKQTWADNYDPLIFMVKNIQESNMSPMQKEAEISLLQKDLSNDQKIKLAKKAKVIGKLERGEF